MYSLLLCLGYAVGLLVANRPRVWWQELFHNAALYWIVPSLVASIWLVATMRSRRRWSWLAAIACCGYLSAAGRMINRVWPYVSAGPAQLQQKTHTASVGGIWIDAWTVKDDSQTLLAAVHRLKPSVVALSGDIPEELSKNLSVEQYPYRVQLEAQNSREILVLSKLAFGSDLKVDLGVNAEVGGFIPLEVTETKTLRLGLLDLRQATTQAEFERNRISSRRLSSLVRNGSGTRIVVGQFSATPFSQLVSIYSQQAKVRSLRFDAGLLRSLPVVAFCRDSCPAQVFVSRDVTPGNFEEIRLPGRARPGVFFKVSVPLDESRTQEAPEDRSSL